MIVFRGRVRLSVNVSLGLSFNLASGLWRGTELAKVRVRFNFGFGLVLGL